MTSEWFFLLINEHGLKYNSTHSPVTEDGQVSGDKKVGTAMPMSHVI